MKYRLFILFLLVAMAHLADAQKVDVQLRYGPNAFELNDSTTTYQEKEITFTQLKFYLSGFTLFYKDSMVWQENNSFHLVDAANSKSQQWELALPKGLVYDAMQFHIGVDSTTSCSGAMGGDLDPTKGMFWSWNSGYINFKFEGHYPDCPSRNHKFEYHLGGYAFPNATLQQFEIKATPGSPINITMDLARFLSSLSLEKEYRVMSPGPAALEMAVKSRKICVNALER